MTMIPHKDNCKCKSDPDAWFVDSPQHHNCFWTYLKYNNRSHTLHEVALLLKLSISAITAIERKALKRLSRKELLKIFKK